MHNQNIILSIFDTIINRNDYVSALNILEKLDKFAKNKRESIIRKTSSSAYRKIHSMISAVLDKLSSIGEYQETVDKDVSLIISELTRVSILVKYQESRDLFHKEMAEGIYRIIAVHLIPTLQKYLSTKNKSYLETAKKQADALKIILDGILAFHLKSLKRT